MLPSFIKRKELCVLIHMKARNLPQRWVLYYAMLEVLLSAFMCTIGDLWALGALWDSLSTKCPLFSTERIDLPSQRTFKHYSTAVDL